MVAPSLAEKSSNCAVVFAIVVAIAACADQTDDEEEDEVLGPRQVDWCPSNLGAEIAVEPWAHLSRIGTLPAEIPFGGALLGDSNTLAAYWLAFGQGEPVPEFDFTTNQLLAYAADHRAGPCENGAANCLTGVFESQLGGSVLMAADERYFGCSESTRYVSDASLYAVPLTSIGFCSDETVCWDADTGTPARGGKR